MPLWHRLDIARVLIQGDEGPPWTEGTIRQLVAAGLVRRIDDADIVMCDACDMSHVEHVVFIDEPAEAGRRAYIRCRDSGRIRVPLERLRQWEADWRGMATALRAALGCTGTITEEVPERLWFVGSTVLNRRPREILLGRGMSWADAAGVVGQSRRLRSNARPIVIVPNDIPPIAIWQGQQPIVFALSAIAQIAGSGLRIEMGRIEAALAAAQLPSETKSPFRALVCVRGAKPEWQDLGEEEYRRLREDLTPWDIFASERERIVFRRKGSTHSSKEKIPLSQFEMIRRAVQRRGKFDPAVEDDDRNSARQIFQRARQAFDLKKGRSWALFKTDREDLRASYRFEPDADVSFVFVFVEKAA